MRHVNFVVATLHMTIAATVTVLVVSLLNGSLHSRQRDRLGRPHRSRGAAKRLAPAYYVGITRIGALKSGMLGNIRSVTSIVAAFALFGEWLTPVRLVGGAMVIAGILIMRRHDARAAAGRTT